MTRVIAGYARGRRLAVPRGAGTRPTSDRVREAMFSTLESLRGPLAGAAVLDLYAGSGALGLEALSRGAAQVRLVESDARAAATIRANIAAVGGPGAAVEVAPARRVLDAGADRAYDLVLLDPPYDTAATELTAVLRLLVTRRWLAAEAVVVVERASRDPTLPWPAGLVEPSARRYGDTTLWYGRPAAPAGPEE